MISPSLRSDLAPTGTLRVGINYGNPVLATQVMPSGELCGVAVDLAKELAARTALPIELVGYDSAGKMVEALQTGGWDVAFLAVDPGRAEQIGFTAPYLEIEGTYLVPAGSPLSVIGDVDREGVRVGVSSGSAYNLFLSRNLRSAELVQAPNPNAAFELIISGAVDVVAGVKQHLIAKSAKLPGSRVLDGRFMAIQQALGIPKNRETSLKYLRLFIEDVKASGFVAQAIEKAGIHGVSIAPQEKIL